MKTLSSTASSQPAPRSALQPFSPSALPFVLAFAAIYLIWGSTYLAIRVAVATMPPFLAAGARFLVAGAILAVWIAATRGLRPTARQWRDNTVVGLLLLVGGNGIVMWAEQRIPSGITTLIISCSPLFMVMTDWATLKLSPPGAKRGSKPSVATLLGLALGFAGLILLISGASATDAPVDLWRAGGLLFGCLSWSLGSLYSRYTREPAEPLTAATLQMLCGGALMFLTGLLLGELRGFDTAAISLNSWLAWGYLVAAGSLVAFPAYVWLLKHSTPARVSTYAYVNPIVAVFLGWLLLREPVSQRTFLAAAVIVAAVAIITTQRGRLATQKSKP
jgi:drug/metabolite transporter (DMT)-like permease